jgi:hypothetical protein
MGLSEAFVEVDLHDWSLHEIVVRGGDFMHEVLLRVGEPERASGQAVREYWMTFREVRGFRMDIDLISKQLCSDAIASEDHAPVEDAPDFVDELDQRFRAQLSPEVPSREHLRIYIRLCPPSGSIEVLAKSASMSEIEGGP